MKKINFKKYVCPKGRAIMMKSINSDMTSYGGFKYPKSGVVKCEKWEATKNCGNGLHAFLNGEGDGSLANFTENSR